MFGKGMPVCNAWQHVCAADCHDACCGHVTLQVFTMLKQAASCMQLLKQLSPQNIHQAPLTSPRLNPQRPPPLKLLPQLWMRQAGLLLSWQSSKIGKQAVATTLIQTLLLP